MILRKYRVTGLLIFILSIFVEGCNVNYDFFPFHNPKNIGETIFKHNIGTVIFEASTDLGNNLSQYYSFDDKARISDNLDDNDIHFGLGGNTNLFLVFTPLSLAQSLYVENDDTLGIITFNRKDCESDNYSMGNRPIPEINSKYCWKTNDGNIVEFVVTDILRIYDDQMTI
jgi:hypothetical protein